MQKGQITLRDRVSLALVSPLGTAVAAPTWLNDITCTESGASDIHSKLIISFIAWQEVHQKSTIHAFSWFELPFFSWSSLFLHNRRLLLFSVQIGKLNPSVLYLPYYFSLTLLISLWSLSSLLTELLKPLAFYLDAGGRSPHQFDQSLISDKDLCFHFWSLLPLLTQQNTLYKVTHIHLIGCFLT